jgi:hypothetical protein
VEIGSVEDSNPQPNVGRLSLFELKEKLLQT